MINVYICKSDELIEGDKGIRFPLTAGSRDGIGFVVRYENKVHAYLNRCAHVPIELDWNHGDFFDSSGLYLMCATHGAMYVPDSGYCVGGPCRGANLDKIEVTENDGQIFWHPNDYFRPLIG